MLFTFREVCKCVPFSLRFTERILAVRYWLDSNVSFRISSRFCPISFCVLASAQVCLFEDGDNYHVASCSGARHGEYAFLLTKHNRCATNSEDYVDLWHKNYKHSTPIARRKVCGDNSQHLRNVLFRAEPNDYFHSELIV